MPFEEDYVLRLVRRVVEAIARALKLSGNGQADEARQLLKETSRSALGMELETLSMLDARSAVDLLGSGERGALFVQLLGARAELEARGGRTEEARRYSLQALTLADELERRGLGSDALQALKVGLERRLG